MGFEWPNLTLAKHADTDVSTKRQRYQLLLGVRRVRRTHGGTASGKNPGDITDNSP